MMLFRASKPENLAMLEMCNSMMAESRRLMKSLNADEGKASSDTKLLLADSLSIIAGDLARKATASFAQRIKGM